jgi:hypothetical protein
LPVVTFQNTGSILIAVRTPDLRELRDGTPEVLTAVTVRSVTFWI